MLLLTSCPSPWPCSWPTLNANLTSIFYLTWTVCWTKFIQPSKAPTPFVPTSQLPQNVIIHWTLNIWHLHILIVVQLINGCHRVYVCICICHMTLGPIRVRGPVMLTFEFSGPWAKTSVWLGSHPSTWPCHLRLPTHFYTVFFIYFSHTAYGTMCNDFPLASARSSCLSIGKNFTPPLTGLIPKQIQEWQSLWFVNLPRKWRQGLQDQAQVGEDGKERKQSREAGKH